MLGEHPLDRAPAVQILGAERHDAAQPGRPQPGDDAETRHRIRVVVHEHVVDGGDAREQQLDRAQPGSLVRVLLGEHGAERADDLRAPVGEAQLRADTGRESLRQVGVRVDESGGDDAGAVADHLGIGMLLPQRPRRRPPRRWRRPRSRPRHPAARRPDPGSGPTRPGRGTAHRCFFELRDELVDRRDRVLPAELGAQALELRRLDVRLGERVELGERVRRGRRRRSPCRRP